MRKKISDLVPIVTEAITGEPVTAILLPVALFVTFVPLFLYIFFFLDKKNWRNKQILQ